jgi:5'-methylthioadenosine phosphorylase
MRGYIVLSVNVLRGVRGVYEVALVMGDPDRVSMFSKLLDSYVRVFDKRGILVVNGSYKGLNITLASHGIGCPMASIILEELGMLGAKIFIRIGTAGSIHPSLDVGDIVLAAGAGYLLNGCASNMYSESVHGGLSPDPILLTDLYRHLRSSGLKPYIGIVFSSDALYAEEKLVSILRRRGFIAIDMETAILYMLGWMRGWRTLSVLMISNNILKKTKLYTTEELRDNLTKLYLEILEFLVKHRPYRRGEETIFSRETIESE